MGSLFGGAANPHEALAKALTALDELRAENAKLLAALEVARGVCGKNNCNCPGAPRVKAAMDALNG